MRTRNVLYYYKIMVHYGARAMCLMKQTNLSNLGFRPNVENTVDLVPVIVEASLTCSEVQQAVKQS